MKLLSIRLTSLTCVSRNWWAEPAATCHGVVRKTKPEAAADSQMIMAAANAAAVICRPFRALRGLGIPVLGLTPQAMYLSRLRRSVICPTSAPTRKGATVFFSDGSRGAAQGPVFSNGRPPPTDGTKPPPQLSNNLITARGKERCFCDELIPLIANSCFQLLQRLP